MNRGLSALHHFEGHHFPPSNNVPLSTLNDISQKHHQENGNPTSVSARSRAIKSYCNSNPWWESRKGENCERESQIK